MKYPDSADINEVIQQSDTILIVQADNPDADSLGSALALEQILMDLNKKTILYCSVEVPQYLRYLKGWDRVNSDVEENFDLTVIVDASTLTLLEKMQSSGFYSTVKSKPTIVLGHHETVENPIDYANHTINDAERSSAGELVFLLAEDNNWPLNENAIMSLAASILGDTQGLTNNLASSETYRIMAKMIDDGLDRPALEELRRDYSRMPAVIYKFKADLINRTEFFFDNRLAIVMVDQSEINQYSPLYNPAPLIQGDMLQTEDVDMAVVFKVYNDGRITGAVRSNNSSPIAGKLAEAMGGGGHAYASGFKVTNGEDYNTVKSKVIKLAQELLNGINK